MGQNILGKSFTGVELLQFAMPTVVMMVFMGLYTIVDTIFVAHFINSDALAAINIVCPIISITVGLGTMLATGGNAIIARDMGEGKEHQAREDFSLIFLVGMGVGTLLLVVCGIWLEPILWLLGASDRLLPYARAYLGILACFLPANIIQTLFSNLFVTAGRPGLGSLLSIGAGVLNIILDYVFIVLCGMGIAGAALGTGIGYLMPAVIGVMYFLVHRSGPLFFCKPKWKSGVILESCLNGSSEMVGQLATAITTLLFNLSMMELLGEDGVAAITIMNYAQFLLNTLYIGFSMGVAPILGYNHGEGNGARQKHTLQICLRFVLLSSAAVFAFAFFGGGILVGLYANAGNVYILATEGFRIFSISFLFSGFNIFSSAMFTALSNGKTSALISFLRTFVFLVSAILFLPRVLGVPGIWLAIPAAEMVTVVFSLAFFMGQYRKY